MKIHTLSWLMASIVGTVVAIPFQRDADSTYFFTFGNSYTTTQFNPKSNAPSASNPMGNPELGKGTTAGGPNWVAYLTTAQNASRILSYNLAVGGATIDNSLVKGSQVDLTKQVDVFQKTYSNKTKVPWTCDNAVFGIWIGINDIGHSYSDEDPEQFTPKLISRYKSLVEKIFKDGGRKFLFVNVPPASRTPKFLNEGAEAREKHAKYVSVFNKQLETMAKDIARQGGNVVLYDSWTFMTKVLNSPHKYGFPNATCINNDGKTCVWWNNYHPTSKYHQLQAKDMKAHLKPLGAW